MKRLSLLAALILSLAGCTLPAPQGRTPHCVDLVAKAFVSSTPVAGAFSCLTAEGKSSMSAQGINSDNEWAQRAATMSLKSETFDRQLDDGGYLYVIELNAGQSTPAVSVVLVLWTDQSGHVASYSAASR